MHEATPTVLLIRPKQPAMEYANAKPGTASPRAVTTRLAVDISIHLLCGCIPLLEMDISSMDRAFMFINVFSYLFVGDWNCK